ncbi:hypothetical protein [Pseudoxanthomonas suwonensis]|uniref:Uncharacterized protein n=1 Tax=Pseudoxanthomonas suwonensis TaxID=314722 RepID=A0A0E3ULU7_9GAMM|nr:hypothetical protein [Pseudoxanthomonas suwonensis]AKC85786.1 hypothetical protein WQ53_02435 [Pseudoxanthomonas suwonensis]
MYEVDPEVVAMLDALEANLVRLVMDTPPDDLMQVFAAEAEAIAEAAGPEHASYVSARLQAMASSLPLG